MRINYFSLDQDRFEGKCVSVCVCVYDARGLNTRQSVACRVGSVILWKKLSTILSSHTPGIRNHI